MSRHLLVAGTGRAGTSVMVRLLNELGLDTHLSRRGSEALWDDVANAGYEDMVLEGRDLPYVIKSPWLYELIDDLIARDDFQIDGVIIPMRNLVEAATSRAILEVQNIHRVHPWMARADKVWDTWGVTPGGMVFSTNPLDQARILATGFHHLVERLVTAEIPIHFVHFPEFLEDPAYALRALGGCLPTDTSLERVSEALEKIASRSKNRVSGELADSSVVSQGMGYPPLFPSAAEVNNVAVRREIQRLRADVAALSVPTPTPTAAWEVVTVALDDDQTSAVIASSVLGLARQVAPSAWPGRVPAVTFLAPSAQLGVHPPEHGLTATVIPAELPSGITRVAGQVATVHPEATVLEYALVVAPDSASALAALGSTARPPSGSGWIAVPPNTPTSIVAEMTVPASPADRIYLATRVPPEGSVSYAWATWSALTIFRDPPPIAVAVPAPVAKSRRNGRRG